MSEALPRLAYAANRQVGLDGLRLLLDAGWRPAALLVAGGRRADLARDMAALLPDVPLLEGQAFREPEGLALLRDLELDYLLSVYFPYLLPPEVLALPREGALNLHPAYLPWNRGWHTPSWAILEGTPYGATLHWVDEGLDTGPIALQRRLEIRSDDTAHALYQRARALSLEVLREALPLLRARTLPRAPQAPGGTVHARADLAGEAPLDLAAPLGEGLRRLRALTTNRWDEAAWFEVDGVRYRVRVELRPDAPAEGPAAPRPPQG